MHHRLVHLLDSGGDKNSLSSTKNTKKYTLRSSTATYTYMYNTRIMSVVKLGEFEELKHIKWDAVSLYETRLANEKCTLLKTAYLLYKTTQKLTPSWEE